MRKIGVFLIFSFGVLVVLIGCDKKDDKKSIEIGVMPTLSASIYGVGIEKGFFGEEGIDVHLTVYKSAQLRDAAASSGHLDGFMTDMIGVANLYEKGFPYYMTWAEYEVFAWMSMSEEEDTSLSKLSVGISENTIIEFIADTRIDKEFEKVNVMAVPDRMAALLNSEVGTAIFPEPLIGMIEKQGGEQWMSTADMGMQPVVFVFSQEMVESDIELVSAFYRGYLKSIEYMKENEYMSYRDVLLQYGLVTEAGVDDVELPLEAYGELKPSESTYNEVIRWMIDTKIIERAVPFDEVNASDLIMQ